MPTRRNSTHMFDSGDSNTLILDIFELKEIETPFCFRIFIYIVGIFGGTALIGSILCLLLTPNMKEDFQTNQKLKESIESWEYGNFAEKFKDQNVKLIMYSLHDQTHEIQMDFIKNFDPYYNLTSKPGFFSLNLNSQNQDVHYRLDFGAFKFNLFNVPLGNSPRYCIQLRFRDLLTKTIYRQEEYYRVLNQDRCKLYNNENVGLKKRIVTKGIKIAPWIEINTFCTSLYTCECHNGIVQGSGNSYNCYKYMILRQICVIVELDKNQRLSYVSGCFKNEESSVYSPAKINQKITFSELQIQVRLIGDPYTTALMISSTNDPAYLQNLIMPMLTVILYQTGFVCVLIVVFLYLTFKANYTPFNARMRRIQTQVEMQQQREMKR